MYNQFLSMIEAMRTILITDAEFNTWQNYNARVEIVNQVLQDQELTKEDIQEKFNQFESINL
jgi:hypothetical protein